MNTAHHNKLRSSSKILFSMTALLAGAVAAAAPADAIKRGEYLVLTGGCHDCHTPMKMGPQGPQPDMQHMLSGHPASVKMTPMVLPAGNWGWVGAATNTAFQGPWGISYAFNLTPDMETGIGKWTEANFVGALKTGKHLGVSRPILPPMPWPSTSHMTDSDLKAIFAYLRSIPPVVNRVPDPTPPSAAVAAR